MNIRAAISLGCYGTHEGLMKSWDTRGRGRRADVPGGDTAARFHEEKEWLDESPGSRFNPIDVGSDIKKAAQLLAQGKHIVLNQPDQVCLLVNEIKKEAVQFHDEGKPLPDFNLAAISVKGTNLFAQENVGIPRVEMPQLAGWVNKGSRAAERLPKDAGPHAEVDLAPEFIQELKDKGYKVEETALPASHMRSTQSELDGVKVGQIADRIAAGKLPVQPIFVTKDNYILDGHHRWAANVVEDTKDNKMGDFNMPVHKLDIDIGTALSEALDFQKRWGLARATTGAKQGKKVEWLPSSAEMQAMFLAFGGEGSGCKGPNCGRPSEGSHGALLMPRGKQTLKRIDKELRLAAAQTKVVLMEYRGDDEEKGKSYLVEPYSYRENGAKFFGYDQTAKSIKAFKMENIIRVSPLGKKFKPRWKVELAA